MATAFALVLALLAARPAPGDGGPPRRSANVDVTGDGQPEKLSLKPVGTAGFQLTVGKAQVEAELPGLLGFTVIDLTASDKRKEVLVHGKETGTARYRLFRWENDTIQELPLPAGTPSASGNGLLLCDVPVSSGWLRRDKYRYDDQKPGFTEVPQALYSVGKEIKLSGPLTLEKPTSADGSRLAKGTRLTLIAFKPAPGAARETDAGGWYLVRSGRSQLGWVHAELLAETQQSVDGPSQNPSAPWKSSLTAVGISAVVSGAVALQELPTEDSAVIANLRVGSTPTLLASDGTWYLVQSETRLLGWVEAAALKKGLSALTRGNSRERHASQLFFLQFQFPDRYPTPQGIVMNQSFASTSYNYYLCADGRVTRNDDYSPGVEKGEWELEGHTLHIIFTELLGKRGVGKPLPDPPSVSQYEKYESFRKTISTKEQVNMDNLADELVEVLADGPGPDFCP